MSSEAGTLKTNISNNTNSNDKGAKKTSTLSNSLIWFGAGVSIAEIITGTYVASLGFKKGMLAIILGHIIGAVMMFAAGLIGAKTEKSAMETVKMSFGENGGKFFSFLNVLQLVGWTAIMIYDGSLAANGIFSTGHWVWALVIGALIILWVVIGITNLGKVSTAAVALLFVLSLILFKIIFFGEGGAAKVAADGMTFGAAVELGVAMPLSWLPLISDYTRQAKKPVQATVASVAVYNLVSIFMYAIGMGAIIYTGGGDIATIMLKSGLGVAGLLIIVFSTVTTTFLDAYSAGVSMVSIHKKINEKVSAIIVGVIGTVAAIIFPMDDITNFLYLIGSVFAPMIAIQVADYFILKNKSNEKSGISVKNIIIWVLGFIIYRLLMRVDIVVGNTLPDMAATIVLCLIAGKIFPDKKSEK
ncbi:MAG: putative hydroxymethylpyrimidine transporter CytX [Lachnospiraceae bacterium]|nr:putative hydroxymethylpyrimidine transporter CytX [Lachnospiraceae bacterium]